MSGSLSAVYFIIEYYKYYEIKHLFILMKVIFSVYIVILFRKIMVPVLGYLYNWM